MAGEPREPRSPEALPAAIGTHPLLAGKRPWAYLLGASLLGVALMGTRLPWLLLPVQTALAWSILWLDLRAGKPWAAARHMLFWAGLTSCGTIAFTRLFPEAAAASILRSTAYREEMFLWIRTGAGAEGDPRLFVPQHLLHFGLTLAASFLSAGFAGLAFGAVLLNYMNFYVGELVRTGAHPWLGLLFGWPVWSVVRVTGFVFGAVAAAHLGLARVLRRSAWNPLAFRQLLGWSLVLVLADMLIKGLLAPHWRKILERALLP